MRKVTVGLAQMRVVSEAKANITKATEMVAEAAERGANMVCLPELFEGPYFPRVEHAAPRPETIPGPGSKALSEAARRNHVVLIGGSIYEAAGRNRYNTTPTFDEKGRLLGKYRKVHLPQDPGFFEQDYFDAGSTFKVYDTSFGRIGTLICFDQWYPEAARANRLLGAQMIFYPTAIGTVSGISQTEGDWREAWEGVQRGHAIANSVVVVAVNRVGREGKTSFWGGSFAYDQFGKLLVRAGSEEGVYLARFDLDLGGEVEEGWGFVKNRRPAAYERLTG